jgi:hypothetical protein
MRAYILIEAKVGMARDIVDRLRTLALPEARMLSVDAVTGPFDVMALLEADGLDQLGRTVSESVQRIEAPTGSDCCFLPSSCEEGAPHRPAVSPSGRGRRFSTGSIGGKGAWGSVWYQ